MDDNQYPEPDDIHAYVAIGINKDISMSIHKETFDKTFMIISVIFFVAFIIIIVILIYYTTTLTQSNITYTLFPQPPPKPLTFADNFGASDNGISHIVKNKILPDGKYLTTQNSCVAFDPQIQNNNKWVKDKCICKDGKYGGYCDLNLYDSKYTAIGNINDNKITADKIKILQTDKISFSNQLLVFSNKKGICINKQNTKEN